MGVLMGEAHMVWMKKSTEKKLNPKAGLAFKGHAILISPAQNHLPSARLPSP